jgi:DNA-binding Xre family transcriptional regulator
MMVRLRVREVAEEKDISMHKLSQISQVSYNIIRGIFNNPYKIINTDTLGRIADALGVDPSVLVERGKPEPESQ